MSNRKLTIPTSSPPEKRQHPELTTLTGGWQPAAPFLVGPTPGWRQGVQPSVRPQPGQELDAGVPRLGLDQGPDHAPGGRRPRQRSPGAARRWIRPAPGSVPPPTHIWSGKLRCDRSPGLEEATGISGNRAVPTGAGTREVDRVVEQGPEHHPVVGPHGGSSIGTAGGISWKVQVPQTSGLLRWTLVSSTAEI